MCLEVIDTKTIQGIGYKIVERDGGKLITPMQYMELPIGKWVKDKSWGSLKTDSGDRYRKGFHIWVTKPTEGSKYFSVFEVAYRGVVASGGQERFDYPLVMSLERCIVAREIYFIREVSCPESG